MSAAARKAVSVRMKRYWAKREGGSEGVGSGSPRKPHQSLRAGLRRAFTCRVVVVAAFPSSEPIELKILATLPQVQRSREGPLTTTVAFPILACERKEPIPALV